jgi:hypothetical protein
MRVGSSRCTSTTASSGRASGRRGDRSLSFWRRPLLPCVSIPRPSGAGSAFSWRIRPHVLGPAGPKQANGAPFFEELSPRTRVHRSQSGRKPTAAPGASGQGTLPFEVTEIPGDPAVRSPSLKSGGVDPTTMSAGGQRVPASTTFSSPSDGRTQPLTLDGLSSPIQRRAPWPPLGCFRQSRPRRSSDFERSQTRYWPPSLLGTATKATATSWAHTRKLGASTEKRRRACVSMVDLPPPERARRSMTEG